MLNALRRIILSLLVAVIVMTAFASIALRLLTPMLSEYRTDVEQWASQLIRQPISIQSIEARMDGLTPKLNLSGVELLDLNRESAIARFGGLSIHFGVLSSLLSGKVTLDQIDLHGLELSLVRDAEGAISVSGLGGIKREGGNNSGETGKAFGAWLLQQGKVSLFKSHIHWLDMQRQQSLDFPDITMTLTNSGSRHAIQTVFELPEELGGALEVALDLKGDLLQQGGWGGSIYLKGEGLQSRAILKGMALEQWQLQQGIADGEFWGEITAGELKQLQGEFRVTEVELAYLDKAVPLTQFDTQVLLKWIDSGWQLQLSRINVGGILKGKMPHYLQFRQESGGWRLTLDRLNMGALPPLIAVVKPELLGESPKFEGNLHSIDLYYGQGIERFRAGLDSIVLSGINGLPAALSGLTGRAELRDGVMTLAVNSPTLGLTIPTLFDQPLPELAVSGKLSARWDSDRWQLWSHQLELHNDDVTLKIATNLQALYKESPHVAITAAIDIPDLARLRHYIPNNLLKNGANGWLEHAFHRGDIKEGKLLIYGRGRDIVNRSQGGRMEIALNPSAVDLEFHNQWPQIKNIDADIRFSGRKMTIHSNQGEVLSSGAVDEVVVKIEDFKKPLIEVDGVAHFKAADGVRYISLSPLEKILGKVGEMVTASGDQSLKLHLAIPLGANREKPVTIEGKLDFQKVTLNIADTVNIDDVSGVLAFNQSGVTRSNLRATLFKRPHQLSIYKRRQGSEVSTMITTRGRLDAQQILAAIDQPWAREISGQSSWDGAVEFNHSQRSGQLRVNSDLKGVVSRLPHPINKGGDETLPLKLEYQFIGDSPNRADMTLGDRLSAQLKFPKSGKALRDIHIHLGSDSLKASKQDGLLFTGRLSQLDLDSWLRLLPEGSAKRGEGGFDLPVTIDMVRLHIRERGEEGGNTDKADNTDKLKREIKPSSMPPLNVNINTLKYGSLQLGGVLLAADSSSNGLDIKQLVVSDGNYRMDASGRWKSIAGTRVDLKLTAKDTGKMLKSLHFDTPMNGGELSASGSLSWPNSPVDFDLAKVKGDLHLSIKDGVIEDVKSDAGKLLGLFNIRKVLNRVFLDFSDLKEKGLAYKDLAGNFRINHGNLYTDDFKMRSLQADMLLTGRTGLVQQEYDHLLSVIPQISDAVPVAGTLIFGPQVAVALLAFRKLFGKEFDKASMQQYRITGSWENPKVQKIELKPQSAEDEHG